MKTFSGLLLLLAAALTASMAAPCFAGSTRGEVLLNKETITVGDIFGQVGDVASKVVGPAPAPGGKFIYDVTALGQIAKAFALDWKPSSNYERITIIRASKKIDAKDIEGMVLEIIASMASNKDLEVDLDNQSLEIHKSVDAKLETHIDDFKYDAISHRFTGSLVVKDGSHTADITPISGRAVVMTSVARLNTAMNAGTRITNPNVDWVRVPLEKAGADAVSTADQLEGMELRRAMNTEAVLRLRDFTKARLILKGSLVNIQAKSANMMLSTQGRALSDGAIGDTIRVTNIQSNRTIDAVVVGSDTVSVLPTFNNSNKVANR